MDRVHGWAAKSDFSGARKFARNIKSETGCEMVARKCKIFSMDRDVLGDCHERALIPEELQHIEESIYKRQMLRLRINTVRTEHRTLYNSFNVRTTPITNTEILKALPSLR